MIDSSNKLAYRSIDKVPGEIWKYFLITDKSDNIYTFKINNYARLKQIGYEYDENLQIYNLTEHTVKQELNTSKELIFHFTSLDRKTHTVNTFYILHQLFTDEELFRLPPHLELVTSLSLENLPNEEWRDAVGFGGRYQVSNFGRVKSIRYWNSSSQTYLDRILIMRWNSSTHRYFQVPLTDLDHCPKMYPIHRLIAKAFVPIPQELLDQGYTWDTLEVNHKDEDKLNNYVNNLEWCLGEYNHNYGTRNSRCADSNKKPVAQFDKDGNLLRVYSWAGEASDIVGCAKAHICSCANHKFSSCAGYLWEYPTPYHLCYKKLRPEEIRPVNLRPDQTRVAIDVYNTETNEVFHCSSMHEAGKVVGTRYTSLYPALYNERLYKRKWLIKYHKQEEK